MVQVSFHRFGNCNGLWTKFSNGSTFRHSGQRPPIPFYIDVNFAEFQFGVLATIAGLITSHCVDDVLAVNRNNFLALACLACLSSLLWLFQTKKVLFRHKFIAFLVQHPNVSRHCVASNMFFFHETASRIYKLIKDILESGHCILQWQAICGTLGVQLHSDVWSVWRGKTVSFFMSPT